MKLLSAVSSKRMIMAKRKISWLAKEVKKEIFQKNKKRKKK